MELCKTKKVAREQNSSSYLLELEDKLAAIVGNVDSVGFLAADAHGAQEIETKRRDCHGRRVH